MGAPACKTSSEGETAGYRAHHRPGPREFRAHSAACDTHIKSGLTLLVDVRSVREARKTAVKALTAAARRQMEWVTVARSETMLVGREAGIRLQPCS